MVQTYWHWPTPSVTTQTKRDCKPCFPLLLSKCGVDQWPRTCCCASPPWPAQPGFQGWSICVSMPACNVALFYASTPGYMGHG
eukprot:1139151-Pelagomonas_calceolata.AAC.5